MVGDVSISFLDIDILVLESMILP